MKCPICGNIKWKYIRRSLPSTYVCTKCGASDVDGHGISDKDGKLVEDAYGKKVK